jgi:hypothetical protein
MSWWNPKLAVHIVHEETWKLLLVDKDAYVIGLEVPADYKNFCSVSPCLLPDMQTYGIITLAIVLSVYELVVNVLYN